LYQKLRHIRNEHTGARKFGEAYAKHMLTMYSVLNPTTVNITQAVRIAGEK
jgi:hypothetical protein